MNNRISGSNLKGVRGYVTTLFAVDCLPITHSGGRRHLRMGELIVNNALVSLTHSLQVMWSLHSLALVLITTGGGINILYFVKEWIQGHSVLRCTHFLQ